MVYTAPTISATYNTTYAPDDGSAVAGNKITLLGLTNNIVDPLKAYADAINTAITSAFAQLLLGSTSTKSSGFTVSATNDPGKLFNCTNAMTVALPAAATAGDGFSVAVYNNSAGAIIIDPNSTELVNGATTITLDKKYSACFLICNGSAWYALVINQFLQTQVSLASATTTDLGTATSNNVNITGTTTITSFGSTASLGNPIYSLTFAGALTLTHNGTSLICPGSANITTAAGDTAIVEYISAGNWRVRNYSPATGKAIASPASPTRQYLLSGSSATYTTPANCKAIIVKAIGGGGGGGAITTNAGGTGGTTTFNSVNAIGGSGGGIYGTTGKGGTGGTGGTGTATFRIAGGDGCSCGPVISAAVISGANGGSGVFGGAGRGGLNSEAGQPAKANTGGGGGGAGGTGSGASGGGAGGGAGEYFELYIASPAATYTYSIGAAGSAGGAGGIAGGAGATGVIIVEEYY